MSPDVELSEISVLKGGKGKSPGGTGDSHGDITKHNPPDNSETSAKLSTLIHAMAFHLIHKTPQLDPFPYKFHVMEDAVGEPFILEECDGQEVRRVSNTRVSHAILKFIRDQGFPLGMIKLTSDHTNKIIHQFCAIAPRIARPAMVLQKNEPGLTYRRLPFDFEDDPGLVKSPAFLEMMSRTTNMVALMQWIGSLFDPHADMQQYVWLYGAGQNGKSALGRFLSRVLEGSARSVQPPAMSDRFWTINLIGKRLVIYGDCNNARFVTSGLFKSMTGGDAISAEIKMGATLQVVLEAKHLFFSNKKPGIDGGEADQRRIILCEMAPIGGEPDPNYEDKLWTEAATFLGECIRLYNIHTGGRARIKADQTAARELALENDEFYESVFHSCFLVRPDREPLSAASFIEALRNKGLRSNQEIHQFRDYIERQHGIKRARVPRAGFVYPGICANILGNA